MKKIMVTGGAGFIGSNFVRMLLNEREDYNVIVFDALTYAGHLENLEDVKNDPRFSFVKGDIRNAEDIACPVKECDIIINFAAESHVDRSIHKPEEFITTDVMGIFTLCEAARKSDVELLIQISTDEVYGDVEEGASVETDPLCPNSPYSASKAGGELLARSYFRTYDLPVIITRGSNTYGPYQQPEKLVPLFVSNAIEGKHLPVYGDGMQIRDWLHVLDHCSGVLTAMEKGIAGEIYNVGGSNNRPNKEIVEMILKETGKDESIIKHVADRPGHDRRYCLNSDKLESIGWKRTQKFEQAMPETIRWYIQNESWWKPIKNGTAHQEFSESWYKGR
jgi:dTDP-glucose 4,6-dehydratase